MKKADMILTPSWRASQSERTATLSKCIVCAKRIGYYRLFDRVPGGVIHRSCHMTGQVEILPSEYGNDGFSGPATVLRVDGDDVLVEIRNHEVWFHRQRIGSCDA